MSLRPTPGGMKINCEANCTFKSTQYFSIYSAPYNYTLKAQDCVDSTFTKCPAHTGWNVTATTKSVSVTDF